MINNLYIIIALIIVILVIAYIIYIFNYDTFFKKNITEKFVDEGIDPSTQTIRKDNCTTANMGPTNVKLRKCRVYNTRNIDLCNNNEELFKLSVNQLKILLKLALSDVSNTQKINYNGVEYTAIVIKNVINDKKTYGLKNTCKFEPNNLYEIESIETNEGTNNYTETKDPMIYINNSFVNGEDEIYGCLLPLNPEDIIDDDDDDEYNGFIKQNIVDKYGPTNKRCINNFIMDGDEKKATTDTPIINIKCKSVNDGSKCPSEFDNYHQINDFTAFENDYSIDIENDTIFMKINIDGNVSYVKYNDKKLSNDINTSSPEFISYIDNVKKEFFTFKYTKSEPDNTSFPYFAATNNITRNTTNNKNVVLKSEVSSSYKLIGGRTIDDTDATPHKIFDKDIENVGWETRPESYNKYVDTSYNGEFLKCDLGLDIYVKNFVIHPVSGKSSEGPKFFRLYGTDNKDEFDSLKPLRTLEIRDNDTLVSPSSYNETTIDDTQYYYYEFTSLSDSNFIKFPQDTECHIFMIGGGGGGGYNHGGGGGAGAYLLYDDVTITFNANTNYNIKVGRGGDGATSTRSAENGESSIIKRGDIDIFIASGGGGGGSSTTDNKGLDGGCGGGGNGWSGNTSSFVKYDGGLSVSNEKGASNGFAGGKGYNDHPGKVLAGGGGGGIGGKGYSGGVFNGLKFTMYSYRDRIKRVRNGYWRGYNYYSCYYRNRWSWWGGRYHFTRQRVCYRRYGRRWITYFRNIYDGSSPNFPGHFSANNRIIDGYRIKEGYSDIVNYRWGSGKVLDRSNDNVIVNFKGFIKVDDTGEYKFKLTVDDGGYLNINNQVLIGNRKDKAWKDQGDTSYDSISITLNAGDYYPIDIWFYENKGGATVILQYSFKRIGTSSYTGFSIFPKNFLFIDNEVNTSGLTNSVSSNGGNGKVINFTGIEVGYGGGGAGGAGVNYQWGKHGEGGSVVIDNKKIILGGNSAFSRENQVGGDAVANTGSGGGSAKAEKGGKGADGKVIIRWRKVATTTARTSSYKLLYEQNATNLPATVPTSGLTYNISNELVRTSYRYYILLIQSDWNNKKGASIAELVFNGYEFPSGKAIPNYDPEIYLTPITLPKDTYSFTFDKNNKIKEYYNNTLSKFTFANNFRNDMLSIESIILDKSIKNIGLHTEKEEQKNICDKLEQKLKENGIFESTKALTFEEINTITGTSLTTTIVNRILSNVNLTTLYFMYYINYTGLFNSKFLTSNDDCIYIKLL